MCVFTQKYQRPSCVFFTKHYISYQKHLNPSNYKTCLYNLFVCLYTKKYQRPSSVFFKKHYISKILLCFFTKHYISYQKHLNLSNYKTCLYNLFVCLYTKKYQRPSCVFFTKHYISKILLCFFTKHYISYQKHLNPSNYKTCLYNLFVCLYTKNTKDPPVFFHKTLFHKHPVIYPSK